MCIELCPSITGFGSASDQRHLAKDVRPLGSSHDAGAWTSCVGQENACRTRHARTGLGRSAQPRGAEGSLPLRGRLSDIRACVGRSSKYRFVFVGLGLALIAVVGLGIVFGTPDRPGAERPPQVEAVSPEPGQTVVRQTRIEVDMAGGYAMDLFVDGFRIPAEELFFVEGTGVYSWQAGADRVINELTPGQHKVLIRWQTLSGLPDVGEYSWTFRVY